MKLLIHTCAVFPTKEDADRKLWIFIQSARKAMKDRAYPVSFYGIGERFPGYKIMKLDMQLRFLKTVQDYTHVLYTDSWDAFFTGPISEIVSKYEAMGAPPILMSAYDGLANVSEPDKDYPNCFDQSIRYRHPHVGGYIAELPAIIEAFERMLTLPRQTGDDCFNFYDAWQEGWFRPALDSNCEIFQVTDADTMAHPGTGRLVNTHTNSEPCILHLSGGYTDQITGKDRVMVPWAQRLGIIQ